MDEVAVGLLGFAAMWIVFGLCFLSGWVFRGRREISYKERWLTATALLTGADDDDEFNGWQIKQVIRKGEWTMNGKVKPAKFTCFELVRNDGAEIQVPWDHAYFGVPFGMDDFEKHMAEYRKKVERARSKLVHDAKVLK